MNETGSYQQSDNASEQYISGVEGDDHDYENNLGESIEHDDNEEMYEDNEKGNYEDGEEMIDGEDEEFVDDEGMGEHDNLDDFTDGNFSVKHDESKNYSGVSDGVSEYI